MKHKLILYLALVLVSAACHKDKTGIISTASGPGMPLYNFRCDTLIEPSGFWNDTIKDKSKYTTMFYKNPLNLNEAVMVKYGVMHSINLSTKISYPIYGGPQTTVMSRLGWVVFNNYPQYQILIIKANGDSLKNLTPNLTTGAMDPVWDYSGKYVYCATPYSQIYGASITYKFDMSGNIVDSFPNFHGSISFKSRDKMFGVKLIANNNVFVVMDMAAKTYTPLASPGSIGFNSMTNDDRYLYFANATYFGRYNTLTGQKEVIKRICPTFHISSVQIPYGSSEVDLNVMNYDTIPHMYGKRLVSSTAVQMDLNSGYFFEVPLFN